MFWRFSAGPVRSISSGAEVCGGLRILHLLHLLHLLEPWHPNTHQVASHTRFKSSNHLSNWPGCFCVQLVSILFCFINVSVIQNFVPLHFFLFAAFLSLSFIDWWWKLSLLPRVQITVFSKTIKVNVIFLDSGQICSAVVNYTKIIDQQTLGRPIQVSGAFYSIKKSRVINNS